MHIGPDAVHISFGALDGMFRNNYIGIYVDYRATSGGTVDARGLSFYHNDIGIYLEKNQNFRASFLNLIEAKFINNTVDIQNNTGTIWWTPMSFFWHHPSDDKYETHASNKLNARQWQPVVKGTVTVDGAKGMNETLDAVIAYPVSVSPNFDEGYFYSNKANVSSVLMSLYPPSVSSMPLNEETGVYSFTFVAESSVEDNEPPMEEPRSNLFSMAMLDEDDGAEKQTASGTEIMADLVLTRMPKVGVEKNRLLLWILPCLWTERSIPVPWCWCWENCLQASPVS